MKSGTIAESNSLTLEMDMKSKRPIIPGDLTTEVESFLQRLDFARQAAQAIHIDVADGQFVESQTLSVEEWPKLDIDYAEAHLMVKDPLKYLEGLKKAGVTRAIVHIESYFDLDELVAAARAADLLIGFAVNPDTDLDALKPFIEVSNYVQVMGIEPGRTGQTLLPNTALAVAYLRKLPRRLTISVDGGVQASNVESLAAAGANYFIASSSLYDRGDWQDNYKHMLSLVESSLN